MAHHSAPSRRFPGLLLLPVLLFAFSGCGVLGIATKSDLRRTEEDLDAINRSLSAQSQRLNDEIDAIARDLGTLQTRLAKAEGDIEDMEDVTAHVEDLTDRLDVTRQELTILGGRITRDLELVQTNLDSTSEQAQAAGELAQAADARGQQMTDTYLNNLRIERKRLRGQLEGIEDLLADWSRLEAEAMASSPAQKLPPGTAEIRRR